MSWVFGVRTIVSKVHPEFSGQPRLKKIFCAAGGPAIRRSMKSSIVFVMWNPYNIAVHEIHESDGFPNLSYSGSGEAVCSATIAASMSLSIRWKR
jgi:hypothetical protein